MSDEADTSSFVTDNSNFQDYLNQEQDYTKEQYQDNMLIALSFTNRSEESLPMETQNEQIIIGIYLYISGVLAIISNAALIAAFSKFRCLLMSPERLILFHLCLADLGMILLGGFLLSGTSSLAGRWLFGSRGCQFYAFSGFLFGNANVTFVCLATVTRCLVMMKQSTIPMTKGRIKKCIYFVWGWALFWAVCPLLGWASYGFELSLTTCTINWQQNDASYVSYMLSLASLVFIIPSFINAVSLLKSFKILKKAKCIDSSASEVTVSHVFGDLRKIKMCCGLVVTCLICWSTYAVVCLWVVLFPPDSVPYVLTLMPPLLAKLTPFINPLVIVYFDSKLRQGALSSLLCKVPPPELLPSPETTRMTSSNDEN